MIRDAAHRIGLSAEAEEHASLIAALAAAGTAAVRNDGLGSGYLLQNSSGGSVVGGSSLVLCRRHSGKLGVSSSLRCRLLPVLQLIVKTCDQ